MKGINVIIIGVILLSIDNIYFLWFLHNELGGLKTMFSFEFSNRLSLVFWKEYFFHSFGGIILFISLLCFLIGYILNWQENIQAKKLEAQMVDDFIKKIKKTHK
jgi:hypothetical protein